MEDEEIKEAMEAIEAIKGANMFVTVQHSSSILPSWPYEVVYHRDTKVMYVVSRGNYNAGNFTLLVNPDGSPMLYKESEEDHGENKSEKDNS